jgi:hypothetical protein
MNPALEPYVRGCEFEEIFQPRVAAMRLDWRDAPAAVERRSWNLPEGITLGGPTPHRFGIHVHRYGADSYAVHLVWNQTHLAWRALTRRHLEDSCLAALLAALGTDLGFLLDQPVLDAWSSDGDDRGGAAPAGGDHAHGL